MKTIETIETILNTQKARFFRYQKSIFLVELMNALEKEGIKARVLRDVFRNQTYYSLVIGDLRMADKIVVSHFDTPSFILDSFEFDPFEMSRRQSISMIMDVLKSVLITVIVGIILLPLFKSIFMGESVVLFSILSLFVFLFSVFIFRLPGFVASQKNKSKHTLSLFIKRVLNNEENTSFVLVDDGSSYQMGYQILSKYIKQINKDCVIELMDQINKNEEINRYTVLESEKTRLRYFDSFTVKTLTSRSR